MFIKFLYQLFQSNSIPIQFLHGIFEIALTDVFDDT